MAQILPRQSAILVILMLAIGYFFAAALGVWMARPPGSIASIWIANAIALVIFLRQPTSRWPALTLAVLFGGTAINLLAGDTLLVAIGRMCASSIEIVGAAVVITAIDGLNVRFAGNPVVYVRVLLIAAVAAPVVGAAMGAAVVVGTYDADFLSVMWTWWSGDAMGAMLVLPTALSFSRTRLQETLGRLGRWRTLGLMAVTVSVSFTALVTTHSPFIVTSLPLAAAATILNPFATALISAITVVTMIGAASLGFGTVGIGGHTILDTSLHLFAALTAITPFGISLLIDQLRGERAKIGESEKRFRLAMEHSAIGMALVGLDGSWVRVNKAICDLLGYTEDELRRVTFAEVTYPEDLDADLELLRSTLSGAIDSYRMEKRYIRKDGSLVWALLAVALMRDDATGAPLYFISQVEDISGRKRAEAELAAVESRWSFALESAGQGVWDCNLLTGRSYYSPVWKAMLGFAEDEFGDTAREWQALIHPEDLPRVAELDRDNRDGKADIFECEFRMRHKLGHWVWVLDRGRVIEHAADGTPLRMIGTHTDITRLKRVEAALAESESRWNFALESARQGVWDHDYRAGTTFYSATWKEILGYKPFELTDSQDMWKSLIHPEDLAGVEEVDRNHMAGLSEFLECEFRMRHKDGRWVWILDRGKVVERDEDGNPLRMIGTHTDITLSKGVATELERLTEKLQEEKERLRVTLDSIGDGVICTDVAGRVTFMNPNAEVETDWLEADAIGQPISEVFGVVSETEDGPAPDPVQECLRTRQPVSIQDNVVLVSREGRRRNVRSTAALVKGVNGDIHGAVLVFQDVTDARRLHQKLAHTASHDALTELRNRPSFEEELQEACREVTAEGKNHSVCFIDLDHFKVVNDTGGHAAGDMLLREIAKILKVSVRSHDISARIGGDEFALLLRDCPLEQAQLVAAKVVQTINDLQFEYDDRSFKVGASAGVALITADLRPAEVVKMADAACYAAKAVGRGTVRVANNPEVPTVRAATG